MHENGRLTVIARRSHGHRARDTWFMSRLSYARDLIEMDLLGTLPHLINLILPNGTPLPQRFIYKTLPKFCKHYKTLRHTTCLFQSSSTKWSNLSKVVHGEQCIDPMQAKVVHVEVGEKYDPLQAEIEALAGQMGSGPKEKWSQISRCNQSRKRTGSPSLLVVQGLILFRNVFSTCLGRLLFWFFLVLTFAFAPGLGKINCQLSSSDELTCYLFALSSGLLVCPVAHMVIWGFVMS
ncbi:hypothetical protein DKX38_017558 [Salix brachista]|uniref:Uncharacterized protein n=1 Tax=Salix brachista TaxID=2182728 RepID=A0A5N5KVS3_9ROSI|nr:hypothetical protein DKX38_017558 [Salix brachista]